MSEVPPGDDEVPVPAPVDEEPDDDRCCDLVMTGGVASGVVYPWAVIELARRYRFRNIGGTSVGAMAAALTAAAEYGRRTGFDRAFEPLRRTPAALGKELADGSTRMFSLFQADKAAPGGRLLKLWGQIFRGRPEPYPRRRPVAPGTGKPGRTDGGRFASARAVAAAYRRECLLGALWGLGIGALFGGLPVHRLTGLWSGIWPLLLLMAVLALVGALLALAAAMWGDIRLGLIKNNLGLCKGATHDQPDADGPRPGLTEWLHDGIQRSAGLKKQDRPLTFRDLWCAPVRPGAPHLPCGSDDAPERRSINLQMITTNVTHGRPYRLPLVDTSSRLFYRPDEWQHYFTAPVMRALVAASRRYEAQSSSDPAAISNPNDYYELPGADLPIVVAARLSLSFPLLFAAVPLWAIDYEGQRGSRELRRCLFTDGGASSNFPIHLFDAAIPRWPTFGMWLDRRDPKRPQRQPTKDDPDPDPDVWLPEFNAQGRGDNWNRFDTDSQARPPVVAEPSPAGWLNRALAWLGRSLGSQDLRLLAGFAVGVATAAVDWRDRTSFRLPHVRNRVARMRLYGDEGGLHIGMPRWQILDMAHRYGTAAGLLFIKRFDDENGKPAQAWDEQRWVRLTLLVSTLRERLAGLKAAAEWQAHSVPLGTAIPAATREGPVRDRGDCNKLSDDEARSLTRTLAELQELEAALQAEPPLSFDPQPRPELRLRAPL